MRLGQAWMLTRGIYKKENSNLTVPINDELLLPCRGKEIEKQIKHYHKLCLDSLAGDGGRRGLISSPNPAAD